MPDGRARAAPQTSGLATPQVVILDSGVGLANATLPARRSRTIDRAWSGPFAPAIHPDERGYNSRLLVDATRPWEWRDRFAEPADTPEMARRTRDKRGRILRNT